MGIREYGESEEVLYQMYLESQYYTLELSSIMKGLPYTMTKWKGLNPSLLPKIQRFPRKIEANVRIFLSNAPRKDGIIPLTCTQFREDYPIL